MQGESHFSSFCLIELTHLFCRFAAVFRNLKGLADEITVAISDEDSSMAYYVFKAGIVCKLSSNRVVRH